jgi:hypothetical protein
MKSELQTKNNPVAGMVTNVNDNKNETLTNHNKIAMNTNGQ